MQTQEKKKSNLQMIAKNFQTNKNMKKKTFKHTSKHTISIPFTDAVWCGMRCTQVDC